MATADAHAGYFPGIFGSYLLFGIGAGMSFMPLMTIMMAEVPMADAGVASGVANVTMQVGAALGLAALGTISFDQSQSLAAQGASVVNALTAGYQLGFAIAAACVAAGLLTVIVVLRSPAPARPRVVAPERDAGTEAEAA
jgi:MFS family permease